MDDMDLYGPVFYRIGFGEAVTKKLLTDYKVLVLGVEQSQVVSSFQDQLADSNMELQIDDVAKLIGCWNGLAKRRSGTHEASFGTDVAPMRRAVAFNRDIKSSKLVESEFPELVQVHLANLDNDDPTDDLKVEVNHVDGGFNAITRAERLDWLKEQVNGEHPVCRILTNARCLTEGINVSSLDAALFLNPRNSMVDVIQAVGRVMSIAKGKQFGYIVLPIAIPEGMFHFRGAAGQPTLQSSLAGPAGPPRARRAHRCRHQPDRTEQHGTRSILVDTVDLKPKKKARIMVERWFRELTDKALRRGAFHAVPDLIAAIENYLAVNNDQPNPFLWKATAGSILDKVARGRVALQAVKQTEKDH